MSETTSAVLLTILASSGFWMVVNTYIQHKLIKKSAETKLIIGLGRDRIIMLATKYIQAGEITSAEYENLHDYLYIPYNNLVGNDGNDTIDQLMTHVEQLKLKK